MCEVSSYNHGNDSHRRLNWIESGYEDQVTKDNNFTRKEEWQFCTSYLSIPQVPIVGNGQKNQAFWEGVGLCYDYSWLGSLVQIALYGVWRPSGADSMRCGKMSMKLSTFSVYIELE
jgi:hypothetical protein